jgi:RNA polymerase II subunit A small phosphatase-like protein
MSREDSEEIKREESSIATGDVTVAISSEAQSIITQVSRDTAQNPKIILPQKRKDDFQNPASSRTLFGRFMCCAPKAVVNQTVSTAHSGSYANLSHPRKKNANNRGGKMQEMIQKSKGKKCLALDLDETLVHSSFQPVEGASFVISVVIEGIVHNVYVLKRPGVDDFIERLADHYELIVFTASLSKYADPLLDLLDVKKFISKRLFREHCVFYDGHYVKDLSTLNREISQTIIVDNSPMSYIFHPENAIDCSSYFDDPADIELWQIADFLESIKDCDDVRSHCR